LDDSSETPTTEIGPKPPCSSDSLKEIAGGRYQLLGVLGRGGVGVVYKARDSVLDKVVAIKRLLHSASSNQTARFHREAKILASLKHPNVLGALDFGISEKNEPYLVLEFLEGDTLAEWLRQNGPMPVNLALSVFEKLAQGIAYAHAKGIAHRDIKPSNIILLEEGETLKPLLVDFGLAKDLETEQDFTTSGVMLGTPKYMSPEQVHGEKSDMRSDIYAIGCVLFETLTGTPPFKADTVLETLQMHSSFDAESIKERAERLGMESSEIEAIPDSLENIVSQCMKKAPEQRYKNGRELLHALQEVELSGSRPVSTPMFEYGSFKGQTITKKQICLLILLVILPTAGIAFVNWRPKTNSNTERISREVFKRPMPMASIDIGVEDRFTSDNGRTSAREASDRDLKEAIDRDDQITELELLECSITPEGIRQIERLKNLRMVIIPAERLKEWAPALANCRSLRKIESNGFVGAQITLEGMSILSKAENLEILSFEHCKLADNALRQLKTLSRINHVSFNQCTGLGGKNLAPVLRLKLNYMSIERCDIDEQSLNTIKSIKLGHLRISDCAGLKLQNLEFIATFPHIEALELKSKGVSTIKLKHLVDAANLKRERPLKFILQRNDL
jgi:serine/threonine protein kinase